MNGDGSLNSAEKNAMGAWNFIFNYKKICNTNSVVSYVNYSYSGANFRSSGFNTDFLLLELKDAIKDPEIRFLGWDITGYYPYQPIGIHHPKGDLMKISFDYHTAYSNTSSFNSGGLTYPIYSHFDVWFDNGAIEGGSSGSPLLWAWESDPEYRVIGQAHCINTTICPPQQNINLFA